ncbi:hypothetical protein GMORB2_7039 [Geosmithia morbida]|uniref:Uncharacterized protein n=1 Tax=Geosmithia morbida TaxID=1094350 RepID=A0A9P5D1G7_9HYPO|nr:uncharacterized protein GMORB2_7039 [Geosmithia morbida]KAF4122732.1 hypothetical protein GMORB2_7039 [Geosmithia morbida]
MKSAGSRDDKSPASTTKITSGEDSAEPAPNHDVATPRRASAASNSLLQRDVESDTSRRDTDDDTTPRGSRFHDTFDMCGGQYSRHASVPSASGRAKDAGSGVDSRASSTIGDRIPPLNEMLRPLREDTDSLSSNPSMSQLHDRVGTPDVDGSPSHPSFGGAKIEDSFPEALLNFSNTASSYYIVEAKPDPMGVYLHRPPGGIAPYQIEPVSVELAASSGGHPAYLVMQASEEIARTDEPSSVAGWVPRNPNRTEGFSSSGLGTQHLGREVGNLDPTSHGRPHRGAADGFLRMEDGTRNRAHSDSGRLGISPMTEKTLRGSASCSWALLGSQSPGGDGLSLAVDSEKKKALGDTVCSRDWGDEVTSLRKYPPARSILRETSIYDQGALGKSPHQASKAISFPNLRSENSDARPRSLHDQPGSGGEACDHNLGLGTVCNPGSLSVPRTEQPQQGSQPSANDEILQETQTRVEGEDQDLPCEAAGATFR